MPCTTHSSKSSREAAHRDWWTDCLTDGIAKTGPERGWEMYMMRLIEVVVPDASLRFALLCCAGGGGMLERKNGRWTEWTQRAGKVGVDEVERGTRRELCVCVDGAKCSGSVFSRGLVTDDFGGCLNLLPIIQLGWMWKRRLMEFGHPIYAKPKYSLPAVMAM